MGLLGSSDPAAKHEKLLEKEAKHEEKSIKQAIKEVEKAEKEEHKAAKAETSVHSDVAKAHKEEEKTASKLNAAVHKHDAAVSKQTAAEHELQAKADAHARAAAQLQQKKAELDNLQRNHSSNEVARAEKLQEIRPEKHNATAVGATETGLDKHYANQGYGQTNTAQTGVAPVAQQGFAQPTAQPGVVSQDAAYAQQAPVAGQPNYAGVGAGQPVASNQVHHI